MKDNRDLHTPDFWDQDRDERREIIRMILAGFILGGLIICGWLFLAYGCTAMMGAKACGFVGMTAANDNGMAVLKQSWWVRILHRIFPMAILEPWPEKMAGFAPSYFSTKVVVNLDWADRLRVLVSGKLLVHSNTKTDAVINRGMTRSTCSVLPPFLEYLPEDAADEPRPAVKAPMVRGQVPPQQRGQVDVGFVIVASLVVMVVVAALCAMFYRPVKMAVKHECDSQVQWQPDQARRREIFTACLKNLPAGPKATAYNDWDEVIDSCGSQAYYQSLQDPCAKPVTP